MFWDKSPRSFKAVVVTGLLLTAAPALAETLVVRASGPSAGGFPAGKKLPDGGSVTLKDGDALTLLDGRGTRTLRGPGVFGTTAAAAGTGGTSLASFIGTRTTARARTGAVRGGVAAGAPRSPNLWYVDLSKGGTSCIADPANVKLWRPASTDAATMTLVGGGAKATISFDAGNAVMAWPAELPVAEGASYQLTGDGVAKPVTIRFTLLPASGDGLENTASTLIERKCTAQLDLLIETVALPDPGSDNPG